MRTDITDRLFIRRDFLKNRGFPAWNTGSVGKPWVQHACGISSCRPEVFLQRGHLIMLCWQSLSRTVPVQTIRRYRTVPWHQELNDLFVCVWVWKDVKPCAWCVFQISNIRPFPSFSSVYTRSCTVPALTWWPGKSPHERSIALAFLCNYCFTVHATIYNKTLVWNWHVLDEGSSEILSSSMTPYTMLERSRSHDTAPLWKYWGISVEDGDTRCPQEEALKIVLRCLGLKQELQNVFEIKGVIWTLGIERFHWNSYKQPIIQEKLIETDRKIRKQLRRNVHFEGVCFSFSGQ